MEKDFVINEMSEKNEEQFVLPPISKEQQNIVDKIKENNVLVNSVAGSGKTTTALYIAKSYPDKNVILITYSKKLKEDTRVKKHILDLKNLDVHSFHSLCFKYYKNNDFTDKLLSDTISQNLIPKSIFNFDIFIIDEAQDMTKLYYEFICKVIHDNVKKINLCIIGDEYQNIYGFKSADARYLSYANKLLNFDDTSWITLKLSISYRLTKQNADFINVCLIKQNRIKTIKNGFKPRYVVCNVFVYGVFNEILFYLKSGYKYEDIFILSPSIIGKPHNPIAIVANLLTKHGIPIFRPKDDEADFDERELNNKISILTFHQSKGLQRKVIIVMSFDETYFRFFGKDWDSNYCPNTIYVAVTRPTERLSVIHNESSKCLQFIDIYEIRKYCDVICNSKIWKKLETTRFDENQYTETINKEWTISYLIKYLDDETITKSLESLEIITIKGKKKRKIEIVSKITSKHEDKELMEDVSNINITSIISYYEFQKKNELTIYKNVIGDSKIKVKKINITELTTDDLLYLSNVWNSICSGYFNQILQIKNYDWITMDLLEKCRIRINKEKLSDDLKFIEKVGTFVNDLYLYDYIDCIDFNNKKTNIWTFKCSKEIPENDILHVGCMMYVYLKEFYRRKEILIDSIYELEKNKTILPKMTFLKNEKIKIEDMIFCYTGNKDEFNKQIIEEIDKILVIKKETLNEIIPHFYIYNIYDGNKLEISSEFPILEKMILNLIEKRMKKIDDIDDNTFVEKNIQTLDTYKIISEDDTIIKYQNLEEKYNEI